MIHLPNDTETQGQRRLQQVFQYLRSLHQLRNPAPRQIADQGWALWLDELPTCPAIQSGEALAELAGPDAILRVAKPAVSAPPTPPLALAAWLRPGWDDPAKELRVADTRPFKLPEGQEHSEAFADDPRAAEAFALYARSWQAWAETEKPVRQALRVFERLYALHGQLEREGERLELVLGDGLLHWRRPDGPVHHPVLAIGLSLSFDPSVPAFTLRESDRPVELYTALFTGMADVEGRVLAQWHDALDPATHHPLEGPATTGLLRTLISLLSVQGELVEPALLRESGAAPRMARRPVVYVRSRTLGYTVALEGILENMADGAALPAALLRMVGCEPTAPDTASGHGPNAPDVLFSKPANPEQYRIAEQLEKHGAVLVQGPPGTGKSYTIGNMIGHLLAQGKTVLVTSHTTKALHVVREHVVEELRPLCVSVLDRDEESRRQLEASVSGIVARLSGGGDWEAQASSLAIQRTALKERLATNGALRLEALQAESRSIVVAGEGLAPTEAAQWVAESGQRHAWLPGPLTPGAPSPLSEGEVQALYQTNAVVDAGVERALDTRLPDPAALPDPATFSRLALARTDMAAVPSAGAELWACVARSEDEARLAALGAGLEAAIATLEGAQPWEVAIVSAGVSGGVHRQNWEALTERIQSSADAIAGHQALVFAHGPALDVDVDRASALVTLRELAAHLGEGGKLGGMALMFKPAWKRVLAASRVGGAAPATPAHLEALVALAGIEVSRAELRGRWERQLAPLGGPGADALGAEPELAALQFVPRLKALCAWHETHWKPLQAELTALGFRWEAWLDRASPEPGQAGPARRLLAAASGLRPLLESRVESARADALADRFAEWQALIARADAGVSVVGDLRQALDALDASAYASAWNQLADLDARRKIKGAREALLARLEPSAPAWAAAVRGRAGLHGQETPPGSAISAWRWRALSEELDRRSALSLDRLQGEAEALARELDAATSSLIDRRAWAAQQARTTLAQQQALIGWLQTVKKIGAGTGKRVPELQVAARQLMAECQTAIPVWIMPLARVAENFDPRRTRFDVVIIDEASQSDAMALAALYLGRQVVVVGDDQQVSPDAVGQKVDEVKQLIDTHLRGIPNAHLYDGQLSVYDLALASFGGSICLQEHFRCVPEIIEFSNHLSYDGRLKALREATSAKVGPALVEHRVSGASVERKVNRAEALEVASLIAAAMEQPAYAGATFGVISLVGDDQALEIESLLRRHVSPQELEKRRLLCGNPAQFQGDERDVIFLSVVDAPGDGPLAMRQDQRFKKRYNVAVSRARDQLWVVHSLDPHLDLKPGDLRRRLIEHAREPWAIASAGAIAEREAESPFEQAVIRRLVSAGYAVKPQWPVGHYRIDLVVEGNGKRLAIECDGERYHPPEALTADLERQAILERLGWKFARIRGSAFYREPEKAMKAVFERLDQLGIAPQGHGQVAPARDAALTQDVVRQAAALRQAWLALGEQGQEG